MVKSQVKETQTYSKPYSDNMLEEAKNYLISNGRTLKQEKWQARETTISMFEALNFHGSMDIPESPEDLAKITKADLPWAENHFMERVCGYPLNPAPSFISWPYYGKDNLWRDQETGQFSHTYPERFWTPSLQGIRYEYGNLGDVVNQLLEEPNTRQAYLPMWFPEDTGVKHGERVPCTLGYHFILRDNKLHVYYPMRSCDYRRHLHNDLYMAGRLAQWVISQCSNQDTFWRQVKPGKLTIHIVSLHVFDGEQNLI